VKSGVEGAEVRVLICSAMGRRKRIPRPKSLDDLVGQESLVKRIRDQVRSRKPKAWMFSGDSGCGKTTIARILALSLQCPHQEEFGMPCKHCWKHKSQFDKIEVNSAENSGVDETKAVVSSAFYNPKPPSKYRVFIFDEAQQLSSASQNVLLKYFEDSPKSTVWMICTTESHKIIKTLRRRCQHYKIEGISEDRIEKFVRRAIEFTGIKKRATPIVDALKRANVRSPGFILPAVKKYLAGEKPELAAQQAKEDSVDDETPSKPRAPTALPGGIKHKKDGVRISDGKHYFNIMVWKSKNYPGRTTVRFAMDRRYEYFLDAANMKALREVLRRGGN
jgi:DNA polymerase III, delta subunit